MPPGSGDPSASPTNDAYHRCVLAVSPYLDSALSSGGDEFAIEQTFQDAQVEFGQESPEYRMIEQILFDEGMYLFSIDNGYEAAVDEAFPLIEAACAREYGGP